MVVNHKVIHLAAKGVIYEVRWCICCPNIRPACSCIFKGNGSWDKDATDKPCVHQITGFCLLRVSVCLPAHPEVTPAVGTSLTTG